MTQTSHHPWSEFVRVTSTRDTPIYFKKSAVLLVEAITFTENEPKYPGHIGTQISLKAGDWPERIVCIEKVEDVFALVEPFK